MSEKKVKLMVNNFRKSVLSELSNSTDKFHSAYLLKDRYIGKRAILEILFVIKDLTNDKEKEYYSTLLETYYEIFKYVMKRKKSFMTSYYDEEYYFFLSIKPLFFTRTEFNKLSEKSKERVMENQLDVGFIN